MDRHDIRSFLFRYITSASQVIRGLTNRRHLVKRLGRLNILIRQIVYDEDFTTDEPFDQPNNIILIENLSGRVMRIV